MKNILFLILGIVLTTNVFSQKWTMAKNVQDYMGSEMNVVGVITEISFVKANKGYTTYMRMGAKGFTHYLTLVARRNGRPNFSQIKSAYLHQYVHVKGAVSLYKGKPQITISKASQITVVREAPADDVWPM